MFKTVIVPLDGSPLAENALAAGSAVARRCGAEVVLVRVLPRSGSDDAVEAQAALRGVAERLGNVRARVMCPRADEAAEGVVAVAADADAPLICMSTHGRGGVGEALLGSVAGGVIRRHGGPVLLVGPNADVGTVPFDGRVLVCLDGSTLSEQILPLARRWAEEFGMGIDLVQVLDPAVERELASAGVAVDDVNVDSYLARVGGPLDREGVDVSWDVLRGRRAAPVLVDYVERYRPGLVAMSTHGRTGLARLAAGSVAMAVVHDSHRPVLVHRPVDRAP